MDHNNIIIRRSNIVLKSKQKITRCEATVYVDIPIVFEKQNSPSRHKWRDVRYVHLQKYDMKPVVVSIENYNK